MSADEAMSVRQKTVGAVLMDRLRGLEGFPLPSVDGAEAVAHLAVDTVDPFVAIAKVGTAAEVAVEILYLMTLFSFFIKRAEVRVFSSHILIAEIGDDLLRASAVQPFDDLPVTSGEVAVPLSIAHLFSFGI
jgi:hypothetical protein